MWSGALRRQGFDPPPHRELSRDVEQPSTVARLHTVTGCANPVTANNRGGEGILTVSAGSPEGPTCAGTEHPRMPRRITCHALASTTRPLPAPHLSAPFLPRHAARQARP